MSEKIPRASVLLPFSYFLFHNQNLPKMAGNGSSHDEELEEALRLSMIVNNNTTSGTERQSNSTTGVGGTQSRSTASPEEFAQMIAFCLATVIQQSSPPSASQEPTRADQPGMGFPLSRSHNQLRLFVFQCRSIETAHGLPREFGVIPPPVF